MINSGDKQFLSILVSRPQERDKQRREVNSLIAEINLFLLSIESHFLLGTAPSKNDPKGDSTCTNYSDFLKFISSVIDIPVTHQV